MWRAEAMGQNRIVVSCDCPEVRNIISNTVCCDRAEDKLFKNEKGL